MSLAKRPYSDLLSIAGDLACSGVEVRNDLAMPLFDGLSPAVAGRMATKNGLRIHALAEVKAFTDFSDETLRRAKELAEIAVACGAQGVALIPRCDGVGTGKGERGVNLRTALSELQPLLAEYGLIGFVEPLGFTHSALRSKLETVEAIEQCGGREQFKLVHDTFHHYLSGDTALYPEYTGMVHVSGVTDLTVEVENFCDQHRAFVGEEDRLNNIAQLQALIEAGYNGPISMEAFATEVHDFDDPGEKLAGSFEYIAAALKVQAA